MPKDNIERAIKKAAGGDAENYETIRYEGYGPGGVAMIVEALTDNRNRTAGAVRSVFHQIRRQSRRNRFRLLHVRPRRRDRLSGADGGSADQVLEAAIEAGADDVTATPTATSSPAPSRSSAMSPRASRKLLGEPAVGEVGLAAQGHRPAGRGGRAVVDEADRRASRTMTTSRTSTPISTFLTM